MLILSVGSTCRFSRNHNGFSKKHFFSKFLKEELFLRKAFIKKCSCLAPA